MSKVKTTNGFIDFMSFQGVFAKLCVQKSVGLKTRDPELAKQMKIAKDIMREDYDVLKKLAKS